MGVYYQRMTEETERNLSAQLLHMQHQFDLRILSNQANSLEAAKSFARQTALSNAATKTTLFDHEGNLLQRFGMSPEQAQASYNSIALQPRGLLRLDKYYAYSLEDSSKSFRLVVLLDQAEVMSDRDHLLLFMIGFVMVSAVSSCLFLAGYGNRLSKRLLALRNAALDLGSGRPLPKISWRGNDELAVLAQTFDSMSSTIRSHIESITATSKQLENERNRLEVILSALSDGVIYVDASTRVLYCNKALLKMFGLKSTQISQELLLADLLKLARVSHGAGDPLANILVERLCKHDQPLDLELENKRHLTLRFLSVNKSLSNSNGLILVQDVSMQRNVRVLKEEVEKDVLTGVMNRRGFDLMLQSLQSQVKQGVIFGLIYVDLDGFKLINDTLGHSAGDEVLAEAASRIVGACRKQDVVARLGGDEFAVIIPQATWPLLENIASRILRLMASEPFFQQETPSVDAKLGCSLGVALIDDHCLHLRDLLEQADEAMYVAKRRGKNQYCLASELYCSLVGQSKNEPTTKHVAVEGRQSIS